MILLRGNEIIRTFMYKAVERKFGPKMKISGPGWKVYEPGMKIIRVSVLSLFYIEIYTPGPEEIPPFPSPLVRPGNAFIWKSLVKYQMALKPANCNVYQLFFRWHHQKRRRFSKWELFSKNFQKTMRSRSVHYHLLLKLVWPNQTFLMWVLVTDHITGNEAGRMAR